MTTCVIMNDPSKSIKNALCCIGNLLQGAKCMYIANVPKAVVDVEAPHSLFDQKLTFFRGVPLPF